MLTFTLLLLLHFYFSFPCSKNFVFKEPSVTEPLLPYYMVSSKDNPNRNIILFQASPSPQGLHLNELIYFSCHQTILIRNQPYVLFEAIEKQIFRECENEMKSYLPLFEGNPLKSVNIETLTFVKLPSKFISSLVRYNYVSESSIPSIYSPGQYCMNVVTADPLGELEQIFFFVILDITDLEEAFENSPTSSDQQLKSFDFFESIIVSQRFWIQHNLLVSCEIDPCFLNRKTNEVFPLRLLKVRESMNPNNGHFKVLLFHLGFEVDLLKRYSPIGENYVSSILALMRSSKSKPEKDKAYEYFTRPEDKILMKLMKNSFNKLSTSREEGLSEFELIFSNMKNHEDSLAKLAEMALRQDINIEEEKKILNSIGITSKILPDDPELTILKILAIDDEDDSETDDKKPTLRIVGMVVMLVAAMLFGAALYSVYAFFT